MKWTKELPTVPGWYWLIAKRFYGGNPLVVLIGGYGEVLFMLEPGNSSHYLMGQTYGLDNAYWLGPLPVPMKPEE